MMTALGLAAVAVVAAAIATVVGVVIAVGTGFGVSALGWFIVTLVRLALGAVTLSPAGIHHRSLTFTHFVPWYAIYGISAEWTSTPVIVARAIPSKDTRLRRYTGRFGTQELQLVPFMTVRAYWLATDPVVVYHTLSFYHDHPDLRAELATPGVLERVRSGRAVRQEER